MIDFTDFPLSIFRISADASIREKVDYHHHIKPIKLCMMLCLVSVNLSNASHISRFQTSPPSTLIATMYQMAAAVFKIALVHPQTFINVFSRYRKKVV